MRSWNICSVKAGERLPRGGESVVPAPHYLSDGGTAAGRATSSSPGSWNTAGAGLHRASWTAMTGWAARRRVPRFRQVAVRMQLPAKRRLG